MSRTPQTIAEISVEGAYGYSADITLHRSRRGRYYMRYSGFGWIGNEGGYQEGPLVPITPEQGELLRLAMEADYAAPDAVDTLRAALREAGIGLCRDTWAGLTALSVAVDLYEQWAPEPVE